MPNTTAEIEGRRYLNTWAREQGYSDYDTFLAVGGRVSDTAKSLSAQMKRIGKALGVLYGTGEPEPPPATPALPGDAHHVMPRVAEDDVDAADADNAHVQGA